MFYQTTGWPISRDFIRRSASGSRRATAEPTTSPWSRNSPRCSVSRNPPLWERETRKRPKFAARLERDSWPNISRVGCPRSRKPSSKKAGRPPLAAPSGRWRRSSPGMPFVGGSGQSPPRRPPGARGRPVPVVFGGLMKWNNFCYGVCWDWRPPAWAVSVSQFWKSLSRSRVDPFDPA